MSEPRNSKHHDGDRVGTPGKILFALCVIVALVTIGLFTYLAIDRPSAPRGSSGPLASDGAAKQ